MVTHTSRPCQYRGCPRAGAAPRDLVEGAATLWYCGEHDPLTDPAVAPHFEAHAETMI
jgi:hypothetical protein